LPAEIHPTATVHPGTVLGDGVRVLERLQESLVS